MNVLCEFRRACNAGGVIVVDVDVAGGSRGFVPSITSGMPTSDSAYDTDGIFGAFQLYDKMSSAMMQVEIDKSMKGRKNEVTGVFGRHAELILILSMQERQTNKAGT